MRYYPAFLDLEGRKCVVVGGGKVASRKVRRLLKAGALVTVISPGLDPALSRLKKRGAISHIERGFRPADFKGAAMVFSATDQAAENKKVSLSAQRQGILVNVADMPGQCSFIVPSVVDRGPLLLAVSTSGVSPAMSRSIRIELERSYGRQFARYLKELAVVRRRALEKGLSPARRRKLFKDLGSDDIIRDIRAGKVKSPRDPRLKDL